MLKHGINNIDCMDGLRELPDETVDLVVTDPPYHIVSGGCSNDTVEIGRSTFRPCTGCLDKRRSTKTDAKEYTKQGKLFKYNDIEFSEWVPEVYRVLKYGTHCYIMTNPRNLAELMNVCEKAGFQFQNILIWDKGNGTPNRWYMNAYEMILMVRKGAAIPIRNMGTMNILRVPNIIGEKIHPTEKPKELIEVMVENSSEPGALVLDPFSGSGSTAAACKETGRDFVGFEIDEEYYKKSIDRLSGKNVRDGTADWYSCTIEDYFGGLK